MSGQFEKIMPFVLYNHLKKIRIYKINFIEIDNKSQSKIYGVVLKRENGQILKILWHSGVDNHRYSGLVS